MKNFDPTPVSPEHALEMVERSAQDERYDIYAEGKGPLTIAEVDPEVRRSEEFHRVVQQYNWPNQLVDGTIEPVHTYESAEDFVKALRTRDHDHYLNNLNAIFASTPVHELDISNIYGIYHVLHRAHVIAPDLFEGLRVLFKEHWSMNRQDELTAILEQNEVLANQTWKAFRILGRLIKVDDLTQELRMIPFAQAVDPEPIESAQKYLVT